MQRTSLNTLKSIIRWCQLHRPNDVPVTEIFTGNEYVGVNRKLKIDFIPDDVVAQINEALKKEVLGIFIKSIYEDLKNDKK